MNEQKLFLLEKYSSTCRKTLFSTPGSFRIMRLLPKWCYLLMRAYWIHWKARLTKNGPFWFNVALLTSPSVIQIWYRCFGEWKRITLVKVACWKNEKLNVSPRSLNWGKPAINILEKNTLSSAVRLRELQAATNSKAFRARYSSQPTQH
jgi:hypothetical protein